MSDQPAQQHLQEAISGISRWRQETEARLDSRLAALQQEEERLREAVTQLQAELSGLEAQRSKLRAERDGLDRAQIERAHQAMLDGLTRDRELLAERSVALDVAQEQANAALQSELEAPEIAGLVAEYERFSEVETTLSALPESYRHAILTHHESVRARLQPLFERARAAAPALEVAPDTLSVVACLERDDEGAPESLTFVLPVDSAVHSRWAERGEDLPAHFGYRGVVMASRLAHALGTASAPLTCRDHEGSLAIHLWLGDGGVEGDVAAAAEAAAGVAFAEAAPLTSARLRIVLVWLAPEVLDPAEEDEQIATSPTPPTAEA